MINTFIRINDATNGEYECEIIENDEYDENTYNVQDNSVGEVNSFTFTITKLNQYTPHIPPSLDNQLPPPIPPPPNQLPPHLLPPPNQLPPHPLPYKNSKADTFQLLPPPTQEFIKNIKKIKIIHDNFKNTLELLNSLDNLDNLDKIKNIKQQENILKIKQELFAFNIREYIDRQLNIQNIKHSDSSQHDSNRNIKERIYLNFDLDNIYNDLRNTVKTLTNNINMDDINNIKTKIIEDISKIAKIIQFVDNAHTRLDKNSSFQDKLNYINEMNYINENFNSKPQSKHVRPKTAPTSGESYSINTSRRNSASQYTRKNISKPQEKPASDDINTPNSSRRNSASQYTRKNTSKPQPNTPTPRLSTPETAKNTGIKTLNVTRGKDVNEIDNTKYQRKIKPQPQPQPQPWRNAS
jgi:hypothetical protein